MAGSTVADFVLQMKNQLVTRLGADADFSDVAVHLVPPPPEEQPDGDFVILIRDKITDDSELATATRTRSRDETVYIPGVVQAASATRRGGDNAFQQAMDRATDILSEVIFELRDNPPGVGRQTRSAIVSRVQWWPIPVEKGGWIARGDFDITYHSRVS